LIGMDEICTYVRRSAPTVLRWIRCRNFPAWQDGRGCIWQSDRLLIDDWNRAQAENARRGAA
jgi:hypothetical protein